MFANQFAYFAHQSSLIEHLEWIFSSIYWKIGLPKKKIIQIIASVLNNKLYSTTGHVIIFVLSVVERPAAQN